MLVSHTASGTLKLNIYFPLLRNIEFSNLSTPNIDLKTMKSESTIEYLQEPLKIQAQFTEMCFCPRLSVQLNPIGKMVALTMCDLQPKTI